MKIEDHKANRHFIGSLFKDNFTFLIASHIRRRAKFGYSFLLQVRPVYCELPHINVDYVRFDLCIIPPHTVKQYISCEHAIHIFHENRYKIEFTLREFNTRVTSPYHSRRIIQDINLEIQSRVSPAEALIGDEWHVFVQAALRWQMAWTNNRLRLDLDRIHGP